MRACRDGGAAIEGALRSLDREFFTVLNARAVRIEAILRHGVLDWLRRTRREVPFDEGSAMSLEIGARIAELSEREVATPDDDARRAELAACFRRCWTRFEEAAPQHAAVISWIAADGLTHEQIAALLER